MASSPRIARTGLHARSVSLPSRPHPTVPEYDEILCRLRSSESASSSSSSIRNNLEGLQDLHDCVGRWMLLPETQQELAKDCNGKWVDEVLDGSLRLLDVCGTAKDSLSMSKECVQELESSLRRKGSDSNEAARFLASRKAAKKSIRKAVKALKSLQVPNMSQDSLFMVSMLREVEQVTLSVLESLLSFVSGPKDQSLVSKLVHSKSAKSETPNGFELIDAAVQSVVKHKDAGIDGIHARLADLELSIEDLESRVECLYRHLIKTRVTLLNIVSN